MTGSDGSPAVSAVLLDRDGVIVEPVPDPLTGACESPLHPGDVRLVEGATDAITILRTLHVPLLVVSNQPAAAKGTVDLAELRAVHERAVDLLAAAGVGVDGWEYCYHHPAGTDPDLTGRCECRKPEPGMLRRALRGRGVSADRAWMVGDADTDVMAGAALGTRTALLEHPLTSHRRSAKRRSSSSPEPDVRASSLLEFARFLSACGANR
jgi:D-glycero-D-manno-heptose 1,7-bisphosphate phosphatase